MNYFNWPFRLAVFTITIGSLGACSQLQFLEERFAPDPKLTREPIVVNSPPKAIQNNSQIQVPVVNLPQDFPVEIPKLPKAILVSANDEGKTIWKTVESRERIINFYEQQLKSNNWEIIQYFAAESESKQILIASLDDLEINISIEPDRSDSKTNFAISYRRNNKIAGSQSQKLPNSDRDRVKSTPAEKKLAPVYYPDLYKTPEQLRPYVKEVIALGSIEVDPKNLNDNKLFQPNKVVTRREFARWLVTTNNRIYSHRPSQEIRLATSVAKPAFKDILVSDRDFSYIQGLAEAGIIPSILSGDSTQILFRPNAPLTREDFIIWKVPLDMRRSIPSVSIQAIEQTWGFKDSSQIDPLALRSLFVDFQNGENSNLRRSFGYTVLFRPNKPVTRAEAVAAFWYFGYQGDGISAEEALKIQN